MSKLILLCGKPGCGKSTLANYLESEFRIIHFSADDYMLQLFDEMEDRIMFDACLSKCKEIIYQTSEKLLSKNVDVVLDFGFWRKKERFDVLKRFQNQCDINFVYIKLSEEEIFKRVSHRNANLKNTEYFMDENTFKFLSSQFEEPDDSEKFVLYSNDDNLVQKLGLIKE